MSVFEWIIGCIEWIIARMTSANFVPTNLDTNENVITTFDAPRDDSHRNPEIPPNSSSSLMHPPLIMDWHKACHMRL